MEKRKKCITCNKPLIAFQKQYLHPETPCSGNMDYIDIEATISDKFLNDKFTELYGKPDLDDYDRLNKLETELRIAESEITIIHNLLNHFLVRFVLKLMRKTYGKIYSR